MTAAKSPPVAEQDGRRRILDAAIGSFASLGYAGTTTAGVAREAGVTQPLVHHHFSSKEGLFRAAVDQLFEGVSTVVPPADSGAPPAERILLAVERFVRLSAARPEIVRILAREGTTPSPRLTYILDRYVRAPFEQAVAALREGQRAGIVSPGVRPELLLFFILGAGSHLFDVSALAAEGLGIDVASDETREAFVAVFRQVLRGGVLRPEAPR